MKLAIRAVTVLALFAAPAAGDNRKAPTVQVVKNQLVVAGGGIYFDVGRDTLKAGSEAALDALAAELKKQKTLSLIEIGVHTDERGADTWNLEMSQRRADAIRDALIQRGIAPKRLAAKGYGESAPLDRRHNAAAWDKNRRIEFVVLTRTV